MAVVPRSMFAVDGSLLVCKEKSNLMTIVEGMPVKEETSNIEGGSFDDLNMQECGLLDPKHHLENIHTDIPSTRVLIVDAMAILQGMKKIPGMITIGHLKKAFLNRITRKQGRPRLHLVQLRIQAMTYMIRCRS